jgi:hypothetical protein
MCVIHLPLKNELLLQRTQGVHGITEIHDTVIKVVDCGFIAYYKVFTSALKIVAVGRYASLPTLT